MRDILRWCQDVSLVLVMTSLLLFTPLLPTSSPARYFLLFTSPLSLPYPAPSSLSLLYYSPPTPSFTPPPTSLLPLLPSPLSTSSQTSLFPYRPNSFPLIMLPSLPLQNRPHIPLHLDPSATPPPPFPRVFPILPPCPPFPPPPLATILLPPSFSTRSLLPPLSGSAFISPPSHSPPPITLHLTAHILPLLSFNPHLPPFPPPLPFPVPIPICFVAPLFCPKAPPPQPLNPRFLSVLSSCHSPARPRRARNIPARLQHAHVIRSQTLLPIPHVAFIFSRQKALRMLLLASLPPSRNAHKARTALPRSLDTPPKQPPPPNGSHFHTSRPKVLRISFLPFPSNHHAHSRPHPPHAPRGKVLRISSAFSFHPHATSRPPRPHAHTLAAKVTPLAGKVLRNLLQRFSSSLRLSPSLLRRLRLGRTGAYDSRATRDAVNTSLSSI
ncbi:hypothetical protein C7M84_017363 [Penaeus vannamei]|uniref:Uncharacterized protein n=1 Tax=Penaeus vannamei TaxID=6689 RepID=A0A3R7SKG2_PENVA|nr:hypothetical protein C7M84_017363 [Penaeus vannamei]